MDESKMLSLLRQKYAATITPQSETTHLITSAKHFTVDGSDLGKCDRLEATVPDCGNVELKPSTVLTFMADDSLLNDSDLARRTSSQLLLPCDSAFFKSRTPEETHVAMTKSMLDAMLAATHLGHTLKELRVQKDEAEEEALMLRKVLLRAAVKEQTLIEQLADKSNELNDAYGKIADLKSQIKELKLITEQSKVELREELRKKEEQLAHATSIEAKNLVIDEYKGTDAYLTEVAEKALPLYIKGFQRFRSEAKKIWRFSDFKNVRLVEGGKDLEVEFKANAEVGGKDADANCVSEANSGSENEGSDDVSQCDSEGSLSDNDEE